MKVKDIDIEKLENAANMLKAMSHPVRIAILSLLEDDKKLSVTEIYEHLKIEQAVASHHLVILKDKGILVSKRDGKNIYYCLKHNSLSKIIECISNCTA